MAEVGTCPHAMMVVSGSVGSVIMNDGSEYSHVLAVVVPIDKNTKSKNAEHNRTSLLFVIDSSQKKGKKGIYDTLIDQITRS
jgi:hypothetical protein